jgi:DNA-binding NtrC family response regulator
MRKKEARILIVDDDEDILFSARVWLKNSSQKLLPLILPIK